MDLKSLASLNRVIIVDNNETEGRAISEAFDKQDVASHFIHFKGSGDIQSVNCFPNARLVILDLDLDPKVSGDRNKANLALTCLKRIVQENSHYVLIVWTGHMEDSLASEFLEILKSRGRGFYPCIEPICLSKKICKNKDGGFSAYKINMHLRPGLAKAADFDLFAKWEVQINQVMSGFLRDLLGTEDQASLSGKLRALGTAYAGSSSDDNVGLYALLTLNSALKGTIDSEIALQDYRKNNVRIETGGTISDELKAIINGYLMLNPDQQLGPGCVFKTRDNYCEKLINGKEGIINIKIDITPICDFAQNKHLFSHYIHAIAIPRENSSNFTKHDNGYELRNKFHYDNEDWRLIINLAALETIPADRQPTREDIWMKLRDNLVIDLQHRVAAHNSRPGHALLD